VCFRLEEAHSLNVYHHHCSNSRVVLVPHGAEHVGLYAEPHHQRAAATLLQQVLILVQRFETRA
jgi:hypothetical protein